MTEDMFAQKMKKTVKYLWAYVSFIKLATLYDVHVEIINKIKLLEIV